MIVFLAITILLSFARSVDSQNCTQNVQCDVTMRENTCCDTQCQTILVSARVNCDPCDGTIVCDGQSPRCPSGYLREAPCPSNGPSTLAIVAIVVLLILIICIGPICYFIAYCFCRTTRLNKASVDPSSLNPSSVAAVGSYSPTGASVQAPTAGGALSPVVFMNNNEANS